MVVGQNQFGSQNPNQVHRHEKPTCRHANQVKFFLRDEWNLLLCLLNISHFSPTVSSAAMAKRSQQDSGKERVTAKSKPMVNLIARTPSFMSSSSSATQRYYGKQDPLLNKIDQGNLIKKQRAFHQQIIQILIMTVLGLLKSRELRN